MVTNPNGTANASIVLLVVSCDYDVYPVFNEEILTIWVVHMGTYQLSIVLFV